MSRFRAARLGLEWGALTDSAFRALCGKGSAGEVAAMIKKDANVNAADEDGETPLMVAVKKGNAPVVDVLLAAGAKVNAKNASGEDALTLAVRAREPNAAIVASLLKGGADAKTATKDGETALMMACRVSPPKQPVIKPASMSMPPTRTARPRCSKPATTAA